MASDRSMNLGLYCLETFLIWDPTIFALVENALQSVLTIGHRKKNQLLEIEFADIWEIINLTFL